MLIVFLAVPALQRNSRNTRRTNDVSRVGGAIQEWTNNNNGKIPSSGTDEAAHSLAIVKAAGDLGQLVLVNDAGTADTNFDIIATPTDGVTALDDAAAGGITTDAKAVDVVRVATGGKCDTVTAGRVVKGTNRQVAIQFAVETTGSPGYTARCQDM
jgi:hypothetical protein